MFTYCTCVNHPFLIIIGIRVLTPNPTSSFGLLLGVQSLEGCSQEGLVHGVPGVRRLCECVVTVVDTLPIGVQSGEVRVQWSVEVKVQLAYHLLIDNSFKLASKENVIVWRLGREEMTNNNIWPQF